VEDRRRDIALFRYSLIREAADPSISGRERGRLVRALAAQDHVGPDGERVRVARNTLDRWLRRYREGGFEALYPEPRLGVPRTAAEVLELAVALRQEVPERTAAQIAAIIAEARGWSPHERTIQRHFARLDLRRGDPRPRRVYGRFEAADPNDLWVGDALHGPQVGRAKAYLFAFLDDCSRVATGYRWGFAEDTLRLEAALHQGLAARGVPSKLYVDNGSPFVSRQLLRTCACLRIAIVHSPPGEPAGRGKVERFFRTVRDQVLVEIEARGVESLAELNRLFTAWVEGVYHARPHSETGQPPLERFLRNGPPVLPTPEVLREAFLWSERRQVTKTATVSLFGNRYEVDPALVGHHVELIFNPFDLTTVEVRYQGRPMGVALPQRIGRHVHPQARPDEPAGPPPATGIDYLGLVAARYEDATRRRIAYSALPEPDPDEEE
jgi:putative transposase